jgi:hypothetical protein
MKRGFAVAVVALVSLAGGCATPARYIEKGNNQGVVAIPANTDTFPAYNRREALALIQKHVGPNYEIVDEREVVTGTNTLNSLSANGQQTPNAKGGSSDIQTVSGITTQTDRTEWRITYRKTIDGASGGAAADLVPSVGPGAGPSGPPRANAGRQILSGGAGTHMMSSGGGPRHTEGFPSGLRPAGGSQ